MIERVRRQVKILTWQDEWLRLTRQLTNFATNSRIESHWPGFFFTFRLVYIICSHRESFQNQKSKSSKQKQKQKKLAMEFQSEKGMRSKVKSRTEKVSLENYIDFVLSNKQIDLTVNFLNQVISHFALSSSSSNFVMMWCLFHFLFVPENLETRLKSLNVLCWILQIINMHGFKKIHKVQKVTMKSHSLISLWITETSYILVLASVWLLRNWMWNQVEIKWYLVAERTKQRIGVLFYVSVYTALNHQWSS